MTSTMRERDQGLSLLLAALSGGCVRVHAVPPEGTSPVDDAGAGADVYERDEPRDPYPTCVGFGSGCAYTTAAMYPLDEAGSEHACMCRPDCATDLDCPVPSTGDAVAVCGPDGMCALSCEGGAQCPDGQRCMAIEADPTGVDRSAICVTDPH